MCDFLVILMTSPCLPPSSLTTASSFFMRGKCLSFMLNFCSSSAVSESDMISCLGTRPLLKMSICSSFSFAADFFSFAISFLLMTLSLKKQCCHKCLWNPNLSQKWARRQSDLKSSWEILKIIKFK